MAMAPSAFSQISSPWSAGVNGHALLSNIWVTFDFRKREFGQKNPRSVKNGEDVKRSRLKEQYLNMWYASSHFPAFGHSGTNPIRGCTQKISAFIEDNRSEQVLRESKLDGVVWDASEIAEAVDGQVIQPGPSGSISTDSRTIHSGQWLLALVGPRFDAHDFLDQAMVRGCVGVIGNRVFEGWPRGFVQVEGNTEIALQKLGASARRKFKGPVVGITGTAGKTTTRAMTALALESLGHIHQTSGNQNNHIGVPLTLLSMPPFSKACVLEMGMNHMGEIRELSRISEPSVRVILNVGVAHMENFRSLEEVARAKGELLLDARPGDICVMNADDPLVLALTVPDGVRRVLFGRKNGCDVQLIAAESIQEGCAVRVILQHCPSANIGQTQDVLQYKKPWSQVAAFPADALVEESNFSSQSYMSMGNEMEGKSIINSSKFIDSEGVENWNTSSPKVEFEISSPGLHLATNACAAAAVGVSLGIPLAKVGQSLSKFRPISMRSSIEYTKTGIRIINDVYNANPMSMAAALKLLRSIDCKGKRVAVLGDMLELGMAGEEAHIDVLRLCQKVGVELLAVVGLNFMEAIKVLDMASAKFPIIKAENSKSLALLIASKLSVGDVVLVKGSREMQMEAVVDSIKGMHS